MAFPSMLVLALFFVATAPLAHALINATAIVGVEVVGEVFCTVTGNSVPGSNSAGAAGANVFLRCGGDQTNLAQATTNASGDFNISVNTPALVASIVNDVANCAVVVDLPIAGCAVTPSTGTLRAALRPLDTVQTVLGLVSRFVIQSFTSFG